MYWIAPNTIAQGKEMKKIMRIQYSKTWPQRMKKLTTSLGSIAVAMIDMTETALNDFTQRLDFFTEPITGLEAKVAKKERRGVASRWLF